MARKRMIDPAIWTDEKFGCLSIRGKVIYIGLFSNSDDEGRGNGSPKFLKIAILPYDEKTTIKQIESACKEMVDCGMSIIFYQDGDKTYYQFLKYHEWQTINRPSPSKIPQYKKDTMKLLFNEYSMNTHGTLTPNRIEEKLKEENRIEVNTMANSDVFALRFERFWESYNNKKGSKSKCLQWFKTNRVSEKLLDDMLKAIEIDDKQRQLATNLGDFYPIKPHPQTWLNQRRWETILENATQINSNARNDVERENIPSDSQTSVSVSKNGENDDLDIQAMVRELQEHRKKGE